MRHLKLDPKKKEPAKHAEPSRLTKMGPGAQYSMRQSMQNLGKNWEFGKFLWKKTKRKPRKPRENHGKLCDSNDWKNPHLENRELQIEADNWVYFCRSK